ncbi:MAG TPA: class I SAM-dependent methyltransferase [Pyrinomonadaceae bacterium]|jgi:ubiquinone/menaquinone biosynthesis C-methylase UbiE
MFQPSVSISQRAPAYVGESAAPQEKTFADAPERSPQVLIKGIQRRWRRKQRRRKVGRAYDMALEIAPLIPVNSRVLDVGCGNGFIAQHLTATRGANILGIDLYAATEAAIDYRQFDGKHFPVADGSVDAALLCYVLHHAQDLGAVMNELRRVLSQNGMVVIYEDIPDAWWDRLVCWTHNLKWRRRTGACTFRSEAEWRALFSEAGFEIVTERPLSRWRNLSHPVCRRLYVLANGERQ